ncbi:MULTISPECIES: hypothetical protein [Paenibacillus]|uniref:hypothetical protein n=1 Tax=Paenibacillus TaxID=44249 RepID=UPI0022B93BA5|nr:hypothetical protein [Paenibacillus caseinilyticus]MCZ8518124.1 hypothetical protein [Paenibacillus caseinilyticus]
MAYSKASKQRRKRVREGGLSPELFRGSWRGVIPVERTTPTKQEALHKHDTKHKKKWNRTPHGGDGSISFCVL